MVMMLFLPYGSCHIILLANDVKMPVENWQRCSCFGRWGGGGGLGNKHRDCKDKELLKRWREGGSKMQGEELRSRNATGAFPMRTGS